MVQHIFASVKIVILIHLQLRIDVEIRIPYEDPGINVKVNLIVNSGRNMSCRIYKVMIYFVVYTSTTFTKAPINITEGLRLGSGGESSLRDISSVGETFNCSVTASAPIIKTSHRICMKIMVD